MRPTARPGAGRNSAGTLLYTYTFDTQQRLSSRPAYHS